LADVFKFLKIPEKFLILIKAKPYRFFLCHFPTAPSYERLPENEIYTQYTP
jgi:hypothetical protein